MESIASIWERIQAVLFPHLHQSLDEPLTDKQRQLVGVLEVARIEEHVPSGFLQWRGRRRKDRRVLARAFVAKAVYNLPTTEALIEVLRNSRNLRRLCGWAPEDPLPSASTFSRAFEEFARSKLCDRVHEALVKKHVGARLLGHICRDSTEIEAREKPVRKPSKAPKAKRRSGRPKKGEEVRQERTTRLPRQIAQTAEEALAELPTACDTGAKVNSKGRAHYWIGYKTHLDVNDVGLPISVVTTSASLHDSQVAIPLEKLTAQRVTSLYSVMDSAYEAALIVQACRELGHVPIIDTKTRNGVKVGFDPAKAQRYKVRTTVERANGRLKDEFGARHVRVRGHAKVHCHIMFGMVALFADQLLKLVT
jgi:hypothetical protein